jgi:DNA modification methylase
VAAEAGGNPQATGARGVTVRILQGDCRDILPTLPSDSFDCIVTSPPYWGLRDYGVAGQIGLEPTLSEYLDAMVGVCRELRRVLKPAGTAWLNVGDSYAGNPGGFQGENGQRFSRTFTARIDTRKTSDGLKPKDLCMVPNRLAIALQDDGWYVRSEIIWAKPNPMPESVTDRPTNAHEKVWLLTKSARYFYDAEAIKEIGVVPAGTLGAKGSAERAATPGVNSRPPEYKVYDGFRNARNVWTIATKPFREAHFATFPPELAERCIKAGCPAGGSVLDPFGGAGTTGLVSDRLGRHATLIELNPEYIEIARQRIERDAPLLAEVSA